MAILACALLALLPFAGIAEEPYDIAVIAPLTGPSAFLGKEEANAIEVIQAQVNKSGGIRGRQIHFTIQDDQSVAQNSVQLLNASIARKATVILGSSTASTCGAMAPLVPAGPVVYCFSPGIHPPPGSYMFSASISTADYIVGTIRYMRGRGWKKVAIMTSNDATGQDADRIIDDAVAAPENQGTVTLVDREHFNLTDISVAAQISRIKASGAQAVIFWTVGTSFGTLLREAVNSGLTIPEFSSAGNLNYAQLDGYQSFMPDNLYMIAPPWAAPNVFPNAKFRKYCGGLSRRVQSDRRAARRGAIDRLGSRATGPRRAPSPRPRCRSAGDPRLHRRVEGFIGVNGEYDFKAIPQRGIGFDWLVMVRWDKNKQAIGRRQQTRRRSTLVDTPRRRKLAQHNYWDELIAMRDRQRERAASAGAGRSRRRAPAREQRARADALVHAPGDREHDPHDADVLRARAAAAQPFGTAEVPGRPSRCTSSPARATRTVDGVKHPWKAGDVLNLADPSRRDRRPARQRRSRRSPPSFSACEPNLVRCDRRRPRLGFELLEPSTTFGDPESAMNQRVTHADARSGRDRSRTATS